MNIQEGNLLGALCKRAHNWEGTGKSLRNKEGACIRCQGLPQIDPDVKLSDSGILPMFGDC